ncbi:MAG: hypothetical protein Q9169_005176 [Polycauliona sp. 2 TL-2023]
MSTTIASIPNEILQKIFGYVMHNDHPVPSTLLARLTRSTHPDFTPKMSEDGIAPTKPARQDLNEWFTMIGDLRRGLPYTSPMTKSRAEHLQDWILANGVSRHFRTWAKEAFFAVKVFIVPPKLMQQIRSHAGPHVETTTMALALIRHIIAPLPAFSAASAWLTLPHYVEFCNLRSLAIWPARDPGDLYPEFEKGGLRQDLMHEVVQTRLRDIGLQKPHLRLDMIRTVNEKEWRHQMIEIKARVLPYMRWVGEQRKKKQEQRKNGIDVRQPAVEIVEEMVQRG